MFLRDELTKLGALSITLCGSRATCNPPPVDTDEDWLVLIPSAASADVVVALEERGFAWEGSEHYKTMLGDGFMSFRKDKLNLIVTSNPDFHKRHVLATDTCKKLNLMNKEARVALFQAVLYGR